MSVRFEDAIALCRDRREVFKTVHVERPVMNAWAAGDPTLWIVLLTIGGNAPSTLMLADFETQEAISRTVAVKGDYEICADRATSGRHSLKLTLTTRHRFPSLTVKTQHRDWSGYAYLKLDVANPLSEPVGVSLELADGQSADWLTMSNVSALLDPGPNTIRVRLHDLKRREPRRWPQPAPRPDLKTMGDIRLVVGSPFRLRLASITLFVDHVRLETEAEDRAADRTGTAAGSERVVRHGRRRTV